jgi:hypothetical protein
MINFNAESYMLSSVIKHITVINAELAKRTGKIACVGEMRSAPQKL